MNPLENNPVIIMDGNLYLYTSYYGFPHFKNRLGEPSGAIYGMLKIIDNLLIKYQHSKKFIIIFDSPQITFRKKIFKEYNPIIDHFFNKTVKMNNSFSIVKNE